MSRAATDNNLAMKLNMKTLGLSPALKEQLGRTIASQVEGQGQGPSTSVLQGGDAATSAQFRPELDALTTELLGALGKKSVAELAGVGLYDCSKATSDPIDALVLYSLVIAIQVHGRPVESIQSGRPKPPRQQTLPKLGVVAQAGAFETPARTPRAVDPLVLIFDRVAPSTPENPTKLYLINKSNLHDRSPILLPGDPAKALDGKYSLILGDEWMAEHGIRPSQSLSFYQAKGDPKAFAPSGETTVSVNAKGPGLIATPSLPPGDRVGEVAVRELFRKFFDLVPAPVRPESLRLSLLDGQMHVRANEGCPATEPFARIVLQNLRTGERGPVTIVGEDDTFQTCVAAKCGDPMLIRIFDHSRNSDDARYERRLTTLAGDSGAPMLASNPELGIDAPPMLRLGRVALSGKECDFIRGKLAATPGSVISVSRIGLDGKAMEPVRTVAGSDGSFMCSLGDAAHSGDVYEVSVESPFALGPDRGTFQKKALASARLEVQPEGKLSLVSSSGAVAAADTKLGELAVSPLDNLDRLQSGEPMVHPLRPTLLGLELRFEPYNPNTGNGGSLRLVSDGRAPPRSQVQWDADKKELVIRLASTIAGGWPEEDSEHRVSLGFGAYGGTNMSFQNRGVNPVRNALVGQPADARVPVRFELEGGEVFARGEMAVELKTEGTGSGAGGTQQTRYVRLDVSSLCGEGT